MQALSDLRPQRKDLVFDLVEEAGLDVCDWLASSNDPRGAKANPKYCYEWAFIEPGKLIILNLWHANMTEQSGRIVQRNNFRADVEFHRNISRKSMWSKRAAKIDEALQIALRDNLPVRVIVNDGRMRDKRELDSVPSHVTKRQLDPEPWTITLYDLNSGDHELTRGILDSQYVDQFDLDQADKSLAMREHSGSSFIRDPKIRRAVLEHAHGRCEFCGEAGFRMERGPVYLETHHIVPLAEGGADDGTNVVALCANDHRRAHFGEARAAMREELLIVATRRSGLIPNGTTVRPGVAR